MLNANRARAIQGSGDASRRMARQAAAYTPPITSSCAGTTRASRCRSMSHSVRPIVSIPPRARTGHTASRITRGYESTMLSQIER